MTHTSSRVTVRLMERTSNSPVKEIQDWQSLTFTKRWRRCGEGAIQIPLHEIPSAVVDLIAAENLAIYIKHEFEVLGVEGEDVDEWKVTEFHGPIGAAQFESELSMWTLSFNCDLVYLTDRHVNTDGAANVDPGNVTAIEYIQSLLNSELLAPTDGDRAISIPATLGSETVGGNLVDLPVRWVNLGDAVEAACIAGDVGVAGVLVGTTVEYRVIPINVQTEGSGTEIPPISKELTGSDVMFRYNFRSVRNRFYVLGTGTAAARNVRTRTATSVTGRLREAVLDQNNLTTDAELDAAGDKELVERAEAEIEVTVKNIERTVDVEPGTKITFTDIASSDATSPDVGPIDLLVLGKRWSLQPEENDEIELIVGHERITAAQLFKTLGRRSEQAQFV